MTFLTPADLLSRGLNLPALDRPAESLPDRAVCAITGQPIDRGYPVSAMVTEATAEFLDCFRGGVGGYVSETAARCFKSSNPRQGNPCARSILAFADGTLWQPLISRESAREKERPCWSELARSVWPERASQQTLAIITTDTKKRLWIRARVGALGPRTPVLVYDLATAVNLVLLVDWQVLLDCLSLVESVYTAGFAKEVMRQSLYRAGKVAQVVGLARTRQLERQVALWRPRPEFRVALLIAQKSIQEERDDSSSVQSDCGAA